MTELIVALVVLFGPWRPAHADMPTSPLSPITDQFSMSFASHISATDDFRQDGSHVIKFSDGIFQQIPYKGDHLLVESFGLIPSPTDSAKFEKSYSIHAHLLSVVAKYLDVNPTYGALLQDLELTPGYTYDTDVDHWQFDFSIGYTHKFGQ